MCIRDRYVEKEWKKQPHVGEMPLDIVAQVIEHGDKAVAVSYTHLSLIPLLPLRYFLFLIQDINKLMRRL